MILDEFRLNGKVALVTGATQGLGQGYAVALAEAGAEIVALDRCSSDETGRLVGKTGQRFSQICCDLRETSVADLNEVVAQVQREMGRLDILVNNAGIIRRAPALEFSEQDWDDVLQINLKAAFFLAQASAKLMVQQGGGKIISIGSMTSIFGVGAFSAYGASKGGVLQLTRSLAVAWARDNIQVNCILPGWINTGLSEAAKRNNQDLEERVMARTPAGRWGETVDLVGCALFLASMASDFVTGAAIPVDGGYAAQG